MVHLIYGAVILILLVLLIIELGKPKCQCHKKHGVGGHCHKNSDNDDDDDDGFCGCCGGCGIDG